MTSWISRLVSVVPVASALAFMAGGACGPESPLAPSTGPPPTAHVTLGFGDAPVEGRLQLISVGESTGWTYEFDFDADGPPDQGGTLGEAAGFDYSYDEPGVHAIAITLERGSERIELERFVVVNDPAGTHILAQNPMTLSSPDITGFEGVAVDPRGEYVYGGDYGGDLLFRLPADDLEPLSPPLQMHVGPEGLAASPEGDRLYVVHKRGPIAVVDGPTFTIERDLSPTKGFFIEVLNDRMLLVAGGSENVQVLDSDTGDVLFEAPYSGWHFAVAPGKGRVAIFDRSDRDRLLILSLPELRELAVFQLDGSSFPDMVAYDPDGDHLYVVGHIGVNVPRAHFTLLDAVSGAVLQSLSIESFGCAGLCAANPVATSASGRFVAFEQADGVLIVDTVLDLPRYKSTAAGSVAAAPTGDVFYALRGDGLVSKIQVDP